MKTEQLAADKTKQHIDDDHEEAEGKEQGRVAQDFRYRRRHADDKEKEVDEIGADFLGAADRGHLFVKEGSDEHGNKGNPHVLAAEKGICHVEKPVVRRNDGRQGRAHPLGQGDDDGCIHDVYGDVPQGNVLAAPIGGGQRLAFIGLPALLYGVDMGMGKIAAEKGVAYASQQDEEVNGHGEIIRYDRRGHQRAVGLEGVGQGHEVDTAADIRAGHHGRHLGQPVYHGAENRRPQQGSADRPCRADEKHEEHPPRFPPDLRHVGLEQQQGNGHRHGVSPDDVVKQGRVRRQDADVDQHQGENQGDDGSRHLRSPGIGLFQINRRSDGRAHHRQQHPRIFRTNQ